nr:TMV resistance protein N-like isoform X1 [Ipomoea batatas]
MKKIPKEFWQLRSVEDPLSSTSSVCYSSKVKELGENSGMLTSLRRLYLSGTNILNLPSNTSHLLKPPKSIPNLRRSFFQNDHLQLIQQFPPNLEHIILEDCKNLKMLSQLPQKLISLDAINCELLETVHLPKKLESVHFGNCKKLKEIQGWENAQFLREIKLRGVPNIKFSENINKVLKVSKLNYNIEFEGNLPNNETLSWIKFEENGSSIYFQWPQLISNLEFLGICIWVVQPRLESSYPDEYYCRIEKDGFRVWSRRWYSYPHAYGDEVELLEEGGCVSFVYFIPQESFEDIKAGEIFKVILKIQNIFGGVFDSFSKFKYVKKGLEHKVRVEVLYRDREDGFLQFLPLTKLDSNTEEEEEEEEEEEYYECRQYTDTEESEGGGGEEDDF